MKRLMYTILLASTALMLCRDAGNLLMNEGATHTASSNPARHSR